MKLLFDLFPVIFFFVAYKFFGIFAATAVAIAASFAQVGFYWYQHRTFEKMHLVSLALITVLGGGTLLLHNKLLIMWKVSLFYWVVAAAFLGNHLFAKKPLAQSMLEKVFALPSPYWPRLNLSWIAAFAVLGAVNLFFVHNFSTRQADLELSLQKANPILTSIKIEELLAKSPMDCEQNFPIFARQKCQETNAAEDTWVNVKLFGLSGLLFAFLLGHMALFYRYLIVEDQPSSEKK